MTWLAERKKSLESKSKCDGDEAKWFKTVVFKALKGLNLTDTWTKSGL